MTKCSNDSKSKAHKGCKWSSVCNFSHGMKSEHMVVSLSRPFRAHIAINRWERVALKAKHQHQHEEAVYRIHLKPGVDGRF